MDWEALGSELAVVVAAIACMGLVASVETALLGVNESDLTTVDGRRSSAVDALRAWFAAPGLMLATLHLVRIGALLLAGVFGYRAALVLGWDKPALTAALGVAGIALVFGHLVPRALAKRHLFAWACHTVRPVRAASVLLLPVVWPLFMLARSLARVVGLPAGVGAAFWIPGEIGRTPTRLSDEALGKPGEDLLKSIIEFSDTVIREIMVPRTEMVALPIGASLEEVLREVIAAGHSRIPIYEDTIDNVLGLLHLKDLFESIGQPGDGAERAASFDLHKLLRRTFYVPEIMQISELLREFQRRKTHMAIVVDEYGGTAGVVTLEDIIEEIVGEIQDEYDVEEKQFRVLSDNKLIADGRVSLWDLEEPLAVTFPDEGGYETLAGFLMFRAGYLPEAGTVLTWKHLRFTIKEANQKQIRTVEIERRKVDAAAAG